jgi:RNA-directed DNA polymerase
MKAEYRKGCSQRDNVEREGYARARSIDSREGMETDGVGGTLGSILRRDNLNRAYKRVRSNKGAAGVDGMTTQQALPWLKEHREELLQSLGEGKYKPEPVRRKEIPKPDGGVRKLGIPTVIDRMIQQAIAQVISPRFETQFSETSYAYRPHRRAQWAMQRVVNLANQGYTYVVQVDLSKYFDTLNHDLLLGLLRKRVKDERVIELVKKYLKSGVMENGIVTTTEEGSPQGGPLSPLLANIYLDVFDKEMERRGVNFVRYADDIVVFARSKRAAERLLESCKRFLEKKLLLKVNTDKSCTTTVYSKRFKFLSFMLGKNKDGVYVRVHPKALRKCKQKLKVLTRRNRGRSVRDIMEQIKVYIRGWLGYFYIAKMKRTLQNWEEWLRRRLRMYIWKQWKKPRTKVKALQKLGIPPDKAYEWGNTRLGYWRVAHSPILQRSITNERLVAAGYYEISVQYERLRKLHLCD